MAKDLKVTVVIPAYNEEQGIGKTLEELCGAIPSNYSVLVVDDGSTDKTFEIATDYSNKGVRVVKHLQNRGYGSAIKTACRKADGDIIVWYDADGQHRPEDLVNVVNKLVDENLDYVIGIRTKDSHVDKNRKLGKKMLSRIANMLAKEPMPDVNSGLRAFKREILLNYLSVLPNRFGASTVTTFIMQEEDYLGGFVPIVVRAREGVSTVKPIKDGIATLQLIMNIILLFRAKQILTKSALFFIVLGSIYGIYRVIADGLGVPVLSAVVIIAGIQLYFTGIISAQISALRLERHDLLNK